jgi:hypothetical protein
MMQEESKSINIDQRHNKNYSLIILLFQWRDPENPNEILQWNHPPAEHASSKTYSMETYQTMKMWQDIKATIKHENNL